jgi:hypothetical protein
VIEVSLSINGIPIRLTDERWEHIVSQHGELIDRRGDILLTISDPERILAGQNSEQLAVREVEVGKWLIVVYREEVTDGFVITAFLTRRYRSLAKRAVLWSQSNNT